MMFQTTAERGDGSVDFNFRIPERIGYWIAFLQIVDPADNFSVTTKEIKIVQIDSIEEFQTEFGVTQDQ